MFYRRRLETGPVRRLLICPPLTDVRRLLICTSITLVRLLFCISITLVRRLLIGTSITLLRRLLACIRTVRRLLVCIGITRLLTCAPSTRIRGLLTTVGENRVAPKANAAGKRGWSRQNGRIHHGTGRKRPGGIRSRSERIQHNRDRRRSDRQRPTDVSDRVVRRRLARRDNCISPDIHGAL